MAQALNDSASAITTSCRADPDSRGTPTFGVGMRIAGRAEIVVPSSRSILAWERHHASLQMARGA